MDIAARLSRIEDVEADAVRAGEETIRNFLRRKVGRWLMAKLLGKPDKPDISKADTYLYKGAKLGEWDMLKARECYLAALIVNELRFIEDGIDRNVARNWLKMPCHHLEDRAPICVIRDGRAYSHLSVIGAAKTFVLRPV